MDEDNLQHSFNSFGINTTKNIEAYLCSNAKESFNDSLLNLSIETNQLFN